MDCQDSLIQKISKMLAVYALVDDIGVYDVERAEEDWEYYTKRAEAILEVTNELHIQK